MRWIATVIAALVAVGCGDGEERAAPPPRAHVPTVFAPQPAGADDLVVATVNGQPVYGSCVAAQVAGLAVDRETARRQCIDFELLAQAAEARGLRQAPEVGEAWRRALVRRIIETEPGAIDDLDDFPARFKAQVIEPKLPFRFRPEMRESHWVRADFPPRTAPGDPADQEALRIAEAAYQELRDREGVLPHEMFEAMERAAAGTGVKITRTQEPYATPQDRDGPVRAAQEEYRLAVYALPEIGRVSPPARTTKGYNLILWYDTVPATDLGPSLLEFARNAYFHEWADRLARDHGLERWIDEALLTRLVEAEGGEVAPPPPPPGGGS